MRAQTVEVKSSTGRVLCCTVFRPGGKKLLAKGHVISDEDVRILESEGLITVHRGNRGGATVHVPRTANAAYSVGLVLQSRGVPMADVRDALRSIEPVCAGLCAQRPDRLEVVLPALTALHSASVAAIDDPIGFTTSSRRFHEVLVDLCGNETLKLVIGALESLWTTREEAWARQADEEGGFPDAARRLSPSGAQKHLDRTGENLGNFVQYLERTHSHKFQHILNDIGKRIPGLAHFLIGVTPRHQRYPIRLAP